MAPPELGAIGELAALIKGHLRENADVVRAVPDHAVGDQLGTAKCMHKLVPVKERLEQSLRLADDAWAVVGGLEYHEPVVEAGGIEAHCIVGEEPDFDGQRFEVADQALMPVAHDLLSDMSSGND